MQMPGCMFENMLLDISGYYSLSTPPLSYQQQQCHAPREPLQCSQCQLSQSVSGDLDTSQQESEWSQ